VTNDELLDLLNSIDFPQQYWDLCDRFPVRPTGQANLGRKNDILAAFAESGVTPRYVENCFIFEEERIGDITWSATFVKQRHGVELMFDRASSASHIGSNFAVLAYEAKRRSDPMFHRDRFQGPPPYPRPGHNGDAAVLKDIVKSHVLLVRAIKNAIRQKAAGE
jgi:hypothetical protein